MKRSYAAFYEPGQNWRAGKPIGEQDLADHVRYLTGLHSEGTVNMGGPFADGDAGLVILNADSERHARDIIENDPAVVSGVLAVRLREWRRIV